VINIKIDKDFVGFVVVAVILYGATQLIPQANNLGGWAIILLLFWLAYKIQKKK